MQPCLGQSSVRRQEGPGTGMNREGGDGWLPQGPEGTTGKTPARKRNSLVLSRAEREAVGQRT